MRWIVKRKLPGLPLAKLDGRRDTARLPCPSPPLIHGWYFKTENDGVRKHLPVVFAETRGVTPPSTGEVAASGAVQPFLLPFWRSSK